MFEGSHRYLLLIIEVLTLPIIPYVGTLSNRRSLNLVGGRMMYIFMVTSLMVASDFQSCTNQQSEAVGIFSFLWCLEQMYEFDVFYSVKSGPNLL